MNGLYYDELLETIRSQHGESLEKYTILSDWKQKIRAGDYIRYYDITGLSAGFGTFSKRVIDPIRPLTQSKVFLVNPTTKKTWSVNDSKFVFFHQSHKMPYHDSDISGLFWSIPAFKHVADKVINDETSEDL